MLLDLSVELLELIGVQLTHSELAISRTVCKALNGALCRSFFSLLVLKTNGNGLSRDRVALLKALATRETGWSVHAKTLRVVPTKQLALRSVNVNDDTLIPLLAAALAALPKIHIVVWHVADQNSWVWERTAVLAFLTSLDDTLHELELNIPSTINLSALQIRGLRKLTFKQGPGLWSLGGLGVSNGLGLLGPTPKLPLIYDDIAALISQNHRLTSLHLEGTSEWSAIWRMLQSRKRGARLTEITTNIVTNDLFSYLSSYSGLKKLTLILPDGGNPATSNHLAEAFFETVLPLHAESLTELSCPAAYESGFSFGTHNVHVISSLHKLTRLEMSINAGEVRRVDFYNSHSQTMFPFVATFDGWLSSEGEQDDVDLVVVSTSIPRLMLPPSADRLPTFFTTDTSSRNRCGLPISAEPPHPRSRNREKPR
ncbi:hypothetical protein C8R45DRAFT_561208 [Mycena sanguinolenta]|nr:hypothetical protein C8R45DRAFT_561208 [Mycena sanguinolenta]